MILIAGASGGLGRFLYDLSPVPCVGTHLGHPYQQSRFADFSVSTSLLDELRPDQVISCVSLTDLDRAEVEPEVSRRVTYQANANLADWCGTRGVPFVFVSTNGVFSGEKGSYTESDLPEAVNVYAQHKLMAEEHVRRVCERHLIVRCGLLSTYSSGKAQPFILRLAQSLEAQTPVTLFSDLFSSPLHASTFAEVLYANRSLWSSGQTLHLYSSRASLVEMAEILARMLDRPLHATYTPVSSAGLKARRPRDLSLLSCRDKDLAYPHDIERELALTLKDRVAGSTSHAHCGGPAVQ